MASDERGEIERYKGWNPEGDRIIDATIERVCFEASDLSVVLLVGRAHGRLLRLVFEAPVAFRGIGESYRLRTWNRIDAPRSGLHIVEDSRWVRWLRAESGGVLDRSPLMHFLVITDEDCLDIVTEFSPRAQWLE